MPRYAIRRDNLDLFNVGDKLKSVNNITTTTKLFNGSFNYLRNALESKGLKPVPRF